MGEKSRDGTLEWVWLEIARALTDVDSGVVRFRSTQWADAER